MRIIQIILIVISALWLCIAIPLGIIAKEIAEDKPTSYMYSIQYVEGTPKTTIGLDGEPYYSDMVYKTEPTKLLPFITDEQIAKPYEERNAGETYEVYYTTGVDEYEIEYQYHYWFKPLAITNI